MYIQSEGIGLASNLVQVLSALLLRDLSTLKHPVGDHSHISKSVMSADKGTGASSIGGGWDRNMALPPPQILWCSFKIMEALNALSMLDILAVQSIPEILKVKFCGYCVSHYFHYLFYFLLGVFGSYLISFIGCAVSNY